MGGQTRSHQHPPPKYLAYLAYLAHLAHLTVGIKRHLQLETVGLRSLNAQPEIPARKQATTLSLARGLLRCMCYCTCVVDGLVFR